MLAYTAVIDAAISPTREPPTSRASKATITRPEIPTTTIISRCAVTKDPVASVSHVIGVRIRDVSGG